MENETFNAELLFQEAMQAHQTGQGEKAESLLRKIIEQLPDQDGIMSTLGGVLLSNGKVQEGVSFLEKAIQINAQNPDAHLNLGIAYQSLGKVEESIQLILRAGELAPDRADIQFNYANVLLQTQQYALGIETLGKVVKLNPNFIQGYLTLGAVKAFLQKTDEAEDAYQQALNLAPDDLNILITFGNFLSDSGKIEKAESIYLKSVSKHPNHFLPHAVLGKFYSDLGKDKRAGEELKKAIALNPDDLNTNILLGNVYKNLGQTDEAENYYRKALKINPNDQGALQNLRRILAVKIPYWHFEMLADTDRNDAYQIAIEKKVNEESIILDIGTGSGLLSMMAARAGAKQITACEMHQRLAATAQEIIQLNGYDNVINVLSKKSSQVKIGDEMPRKANLIISEILDVGALGEGVLPSIRHAVQNLAEPNVQLIPSKVHLYGQLIEIPSRSLVAPIKKISGFDLSPFEQYRIPNEYLKINLKGEKYKTLSPVIPLMNIDFYNLPPAFADDQPQHISLQFPIVKKGTVQALVFWFDLFLDDEIVVSSKVDGKLEHWGQALFCFPNTQEVVEGEEVGITMLQSDSMIRFKM